jgi:hypothetical protein
MSHGGSETDKAGNRPKKSACVEQVLSSRHHACLKCRPVVQPNLLYRCTMNAIVPHIFEDKLVRSVMLGEVPWFVGSDVAKVLGHRDATAALRSLDDDEKGTHNVCTLGGEQTMIIISEAGVYRLIFSSRKPEAERFKRWLAHEVLPALRRDGSFTMPGAAGKGDGPVHPFSITHESISLIKTRLDMVSECRKLHGHERARALWSALGLPLAAVPLDDPSADARECLQTILRAEDPRGTPIHELIDLAMDDDEDARMRLRIVGIAVEINMEGFIIANRSAFLEHLFQGTERVKGRWRHALRRLPGTQVDSNRRYIGYPSRGTFIPSAYLDRVEQEVN